ncbi:metalloregulator ArsR/SmtB family transcription factor [Georgenia halophila]|uniref:Metalloregulator ArsR/SmtB family transcription factor n=1 Tax=Georgenia halophila TaxID=620889 RepID=A0ABP8LE91_9MICO
MAALAYPRRWQIVELLAERPRSVGELAAVTGLRQPQTTKHLQHLARAGLVTVYPLAQRRVYALETAPLADLCHRLHELVATAEENSGERDVVERYRDAIAAETTAADRERWADERTFAFDRELAAPRDIVWQHWTDPALLAAWWAPPSMVVSDCVLEPTRGGRVVLEYRDAEGRYRAEGVVDTAAEPEHLAFRLAPLNAAGDVTFTGHYDVTLHEIGPGTRLEVRLRITDTALEAVPYIAGIQTGWRQVLDNLARAVVRTDTATDARTDQNTTS